MPDSAQVKERPVVHYVDLPVNDRAMSLAWKKHRMRCPVAGCLGCSTNRDEGPY
jgi:hypothetical protein